MLSESFPQVRFMQSATNLGFAKANNRAFQEASGECVLFLNPDTEVEGSAITTLYREMKKLPNCGAVGCRLMNSDGTVQSSCIHRNPTILNRILDSDVLRKIWPKARLWGAAPLYETGTLPSEVEAVSGACVMVMRDRFQLVGGFSEDYFMYAEDLDLSYKLRKAGYNNYHVPIASVVHHGGTSSDKSASTFSAVMMPEAVWRFLRKTRGTAYAMAYRAAMGLSAAGRLFALGLAVIPLWISGRYNSRWAGSIRKWRAVLRWSVTQHELVKQYYPADSGHTT
jgi:GT2 family glycosyltransferase